MEIGRVIQITLCLGPSTVELWEGSSDVDVSDAPAPTPTSSVSEILELIGCEATLIENAAQRAHRHIGGMARHDNDARSLGGGRLK